jgi:long-subunit fatty acid transport protein
VGHASAVRLGFIYDPSPFRDERASLTSPRFTDSYIGTAGYGYRMKSWIFDMAYQFAYSTERLATVTTPSPSGTPTPEQVAITGQGHVATLTVGYRY